ncbi:Ig-like domain-containing protein, partial [Mycobacterium sp. THU-M116]
MSRSSAPPPIKRRLALAALGLGAFTPSVLAACGGTVTRHVQKNEPPAPQLRFQPADATANVIPTASISARVGEGWFQKLALKNSAGKVVAGVFNDDRTAYTVTEPLGYDATYAWSGSVVGHDGKAVPVAATFTTVTPTKTIDGGF